MRTGSEFRWQPRRPWIRLRELPADLRFVRARRATSRETWRIPFGALVIECESSRGPVRLWARPQQLAQVVELIGRPDTPDLSTP
ncbi:hypothetical protein B6E66_28615 [Streptomyces maremycinicus]|nr:hypothetical protein B6E66_28615 [Streptomyces sp. B9173]